ncbi:hypothetical protein [Microcoleus sp. bin38.metabat.b11b12b14.051]|uniref:hypothetical protein n=1 Tax=Microcoleus sp. bin38.metabat.b11b12b14.051 TaxID=2742709 RepID=UPI0025FF2F89|nr:hypothetical protein [Microcoleus sp. bin38.metabat.b11b12b14.051]
MVGILLYQVTFDQRSASQKFTACVKKAARQSPVTDALVFRYFQAIFGKLADEMLRF